MEARTQPTEAEQREECDTNEVLHQGGAGKESPFQR